MLTIRSEQLAALEQRAAEQFKLRLRAHLSANMVAEALIDQVVEYAVCQSPRFCLRSESDVARFALITGQLWTRRREDSLPVPALAILMSYGLEPATKLDRYLDWSTEAQRA